MKIAIVSPYSWACPGGVNNHVEGLASHLAARGHDVTVIAPDGGTAVEGAAFVSAGRSVPVPANGSVARIALTPGTGARLRRILLDGSFEVVHVHEPLVPLVSTSAVKAAGCRVVGTFHTAREGGSMTYRLGAGLLRGVAARLDARIAVSEAARALASRYLPGDYEIVPNGVDVSRFKAAGPLPKRPGESPSILFVGRNEPRKGLSLLLEAFPLVCSSIGGCVLDIIGSGFTARGVEALLPADLHDRVRVAGFVENDELPARYSAADVFCAPATGGESFGIVLVEAMASGTPVVASDIPGYRGVLERAGGGLLFENGNAGDLARALIEVLADRALRDDLAKKGLQGAEQFSWQLLTPLLESLYT